VTRRARTRGAVSVETLMGLVPVLTLFFTCVQLARLATADLVVKHATVVAARAAIVVLNPEANPGSNGPESDVVNAAALAMQPWIDGGTIEGVDVSWTDTSSRGDPFGQVTVTVVATFSCRVPIGNLIVCGGTSKRITFTAALPHQGANYRI
jgi:Flp pilus assembly protein TadG